MVRDPLAEAERLLVKLTDAVGKRDKYDDFAKDIVIALRTRYNVSWQSIGDAAGGVSHQAAQQRYGKLVSS